MARLTAIFNPTKQQVAQAQREAISRAEDLADTIEGVRNPDQALVREILPNEDLESGADNGWNGSDRDWVQQGLSADQTQTVYNINSNGAAQNKVIVFYGIANVASDPLTTEIEYQDGTSATFFRLNSELLELTDVSDYVIFNNEIVYGSTEDGDLIQWADAGGDDHVVYLAKVAEPLGETLSSRDRPDQRLGRGRGRAR